MDCGCILSWLLLLLMTCTVWLSSFSLIMFSTAHTWRIKRQSALRVTVLAKTYSPKGKLHWDIPTLRKREVVKISLNWWGTGLVNIMFFPAPQILQFFPLSYFKDNMPFASYIGSQSSENELSNICITWSANHFCPCSKTFQTSTIFYNAHI